MKWTKITQGFYALPGTRYAVQSDGHGFVSQADRDGSGVMAGVTGGEWATIRYRDVNGAVVDHDGGENLDWFPTMREAKAYAEQLSAQEAT